MVEQLTEGGAVKVEGERVGRGGRSIVLLLRLRSRMQTQLQPPAQLNDTAEEGGISREGEEVKNEEKARQCEAGLTCSGVR